MKLRHCFPSRNWVHQLLNSSYIGKFFVFRCRIVRTILSEFKSPTGPIALKPQLSNPIRNHGNPFPLQFFLLSQNYPQPFLSVQPLLHCFPKIRTPLPSTLQRRRTPTSCQFGLSCSREKASDRGCTTRQETGSQITASNPPMFPS